MRSVIIGACIGIAIAIVWHWLGWTAMLWSVLFGAIGAGAGWIREHPEGLIELLHRLER